MKDFLAAVAFLCLLVLAFVLTVVPLSYALGSAECEAKWANSGMPSRYGFFAGCTVQRADGSWIPAQAYREISQ
jgi:hypothetical protein